MITTELEAKWMTSGFIMKLLKNYKTMDQLERDLSEALSDPAFFEEADWLRIWSEIEVELDKL